MSRIDTPRTSGGAPIGGAGERVSLGQRNPDGSFQQIAPAAGRPPVDHRFQPLPQPQIARDTALSPHAVRESDLLPLASRETDRLIADLARILSVLSARLEREDDLLARQSIEVGQAGLEDHFKRMQVLSAGYSALVMKW